MKPLKETREKSGHSQQEIANYLGITRQAYNHYETGKREPDNSTLVKLSSFFSVSTDYLLGKTKNPQPDVKLDEIQFALYGETKELDDETKTDILNYARYKRQQRNNKQH